MVLLCEVQIFDHFVKRRDLKMFDFSWQPNGLYVPQVRR
jgi:hypothetical protein